MHENERGALHKICLTPRLPRFVLEANSHSGPRTSCDHPSASQSSREIWCNNVDCRIPGILHSAVEQQDTNRRDTVKKFIRQFENHPTKESFLQDLNKTEMINKFSEESKKLIADMNNTEIFELCETYSKKQCPDCNSYWEIGIVYCTCGRCLKSSLRIKELHKNNNDVLSIPGHVIKKNTIRGSDTPRRSSGSLSPGNRNWSQTQKKSRIVRPRRMPRIPTSRRPNVTVPIC